jgi:hypothetical protein
MKVDIKTIKVDQELTSEIDFNDKAIDRLYIKYGPRKDLTFKNIKISYLTGLHLRYSPLTQKKVFALFYKFKGKSRKLILDEFILGHYGTIEVSAELLKLYSKYYKDGKWKHDPWEQLITQRELEQSQELSIREAIQRLVEAQFPRKTKLGKLAMSSQKTYARFLMGYHNRFDELIFDEDEKGCGTITLKNGLDWKTFWSKYPPENKDPKKSEKEISIYDTNNIGPSIIDHLTKGVIAKYLECRERTPGTKENILDAIQCLYSYAENRLKCFGDKAPPVNPTQNIEILKDDDSKFKGSYLNEISFDDDQISQVDRAFIKIARKKPFQSEGLMLYACTDFRPEELLKLKKSDLKEDYILFRKETKKGRSKGKVDDTKVYYTPSITRALDRIHRQYKRRGHEKYRFIPWLFPSCRIDWGNPTDYATNKTRRHSLKGAWEEVRKLINFEGSIKTLRKTYFTQEVELEKSKGKTTDEAIYVVSKKSHKGPKMIKTRYNKPPESVKMRKAQELSQVLEFKRTLKGNT